MTEYYADQSHLGTDEHEQLEPRDKTPETCGVCGEELDFETDNVVWETYEGGWNSTEAIPYHEECTE